MAIKKSAINLGITENADGFSIDGGTTDIRTLSLEGDNLPIVLDNPQANQVLSFYNSQWINRDIITGSSIMSSAITEGIIAGGNDTQIQYNNATVIAGSEMIYDNSNQRVGLNKTPTVQLDITGKPTDNLIYLQIDGNEDTERGIYIGEEGIWKWALYCDANENSSNLYINNSITDVFTLTNNGTLSISNSIGIGVTMPSEKLEVAGAIKAEDYKSSDGSIGIIQNVVVQNAKGDGTITLVFKNGLLTEIL